MAPKSRRSKSSAADSRPTTAGKTKDGSVQWPALSPMIPASDLTLTAVLPNQIYTVHNLWPSSLCKSYVSFLATLPLTTTPREAKKGNAVRVNDRFQVDDPAFAEALWSQTALRTLVEGEMEDGNGGALSDEAKRKVWGGDVLGLNANIRIYRYRQGQFFDQHFDESNNVTFSRPRLPSTIPARTTWTLLLYLTTCQGGETVFHPDAVSRREAPPDPIVTELEVGMALLHRHGKDCLLHEGREVKAGEKWVIRSDLCVAR